MGNYTADEARLLKEIRKKNKSIMNKMMRKLRKEAGLK